MTLRELLILRRDGWSGCSESLSSQTIAIRYESKIAELNSLLESIDAKSLDSEILLSDTRSYNGNVTSLQAH